MGQKISTRPVHGTVCVPCTLAHLDTIQVTRSTHSCCCRLSKTIASFTFSADGWHALSEGVLCNRSVRAAEMRLGSLKNKDPDTTVKVCGLSKGCTVLKTCLSLGNLLAGLRVGGDDTTTTLGFTVLDSLHGSVPECCEEPFLLVLDDGTLKEAQGMYSEDDGATLTTLGLHSLDDHDADDDIDDDYHDVDDNNDDEYHDVDIDVDAYVDVDIGVDDDAYIDVDVDDDVYHDVDVDVDDDDAYHDAIDDNEDDDDMVPRTLEDIKVLVQHNVQNIEDEWRTDKIKNSLDRLTEDGLTEVSSPPTPDWCGPVWPEPGAADPWLDRKIHQGAPRRGSFRKRLGYYAGWLAMTLMFYNAWLQFSKE